MLSAIIAIAATALIVVWSVHVSRATKRRTAAIREVQDSLSAQSASQVALDQAIASYSAVVARVLTKLNSVPGPSGSGGSSTEEMWDDGVVDAEIVDEPPTSDRTLPEHPWHHTVTAGQTGLRHGHFGRVKLWSVLATSVGRRLNVEPPDWSAALGAVQLSAWVKIADRLPDLHSTEIGALQELAEVFRTCDFHERAKDYIPYSAVDVNRCESEITDIWRSEAAESNFGWLVDVVDASEDHFGGRTSTRASKSGRSLCKVVRSPARPVPRSRFGAH